LHNGIDVATFPFWAEKEPFALLLGRMSETNGLHLAIEAAREAGCRSC
jgi:hypothetical protein